MTQSTDTRWTMALAVIALGAGLTTSASAAPLSAHPAAIAVKKGDCDAAIDQVKRGVASNDIQATFLGGRMLDEGICVQEDHAAAARFFELGARLGDQDASLEYAAKVGLGEGSEQSYQRAGEICRTAGFDPQARLSPYSLGYACTVGSVAGKILRVTLPAGSFRPGSGATLVEFSPASAEMHIRSTPQVARESDAATGSNLGHHRVNAQRAIEDAWRKALDAVPKPDAARLEAQAIEVRLDIETALEAGQVADRSVGVQFHELQLPMPADFKRMVPSSSMGH
jgi:hypothetical protein